MLMVFIIQMMSFHVTKSQQTRRTLQQTNTNKTQQQQQQLIRDMKYSTLVFNDPHEASQHASLHTTAFMITKTHSYTQSQTMIMTHVEIL